MEIQEFQYIPACDDNSCDEPYAWRDFLRYLQDGMAALGSDLHGILHVQDELVAAGFEGLKWKSLKCPVGPWPKKQRLQECGHILRDVIMWGLVGLSRRSFRDGLGWTHIQIEMFLVEVRKSISREVDGLPKFHSYFPFHSVYGRKPLSEAPKSRQSSVPAASVEPVPARITPQIQESEPSPSPPVATPELIDMSEFHENQQRLLER